MNERKASVLIDGLIAEMGDMGEAPTGAAEDQAQWPSSLAAEASYGLAGEIVSAIEPHGEADPVAILMHLLVSVGNLFGRGPHFHVGGTLHHANLNCVNVGATASRKGTAEHDTLFIVRQAADEQWAEKKIQSGLSSGEGLIWAVRDPIEEQQAVKEKGRVVDYQMIITDKGIEDKRLLLVESEFSSTLRVLERDGNTLSAQIRQAWDSGTIRILTKHKAASATGAHVSIIGHITKEELMKYLNETEQANGFANRFLWVAVKRSKLLPTGGQLHKIDLNKLIRKLRTVVEFAMLPREMKRSEKAAVVWNTVYPSLVGDHRTGLFGAITSRAEPQVMRLAMIYALLDRSPSIETQHLAAALAVWDYCEASVRFIFGSSVGDKTADEVLDALRHAAAAGLTKTELNAYFGRNKPAQEIDRALALLISKGRVGMEKIEGPGRSTSRYFVLDPGTKYTK